MAEERSVMNLSGSLVYAGIAHKKQIQMYLIFCGRFYGNAELSVHSDGLSWWSRTCTVLVSVSTQSCSWSCPQCWYNLVLVMTTTLASSTDRGQLLGDHLPGYVVVFLLPLIKSIPDLELRLNHFCLRFKHELCLHNGSPWWGLHGKGGNKSGSVSAKARAQDLLWILLLPTFCFIVWQERADHDIVVAIGMWALSFHRGGRGGAFSLNLANMCWKWKTDRVTVFVGEVWCCGRATEELHKTAQTFGWQKKKKVQSVRVHCSESSLAERWECRASTRL